jgi:hypothetical protein
MRRLTTIAGCVVAASIVMVATSRASEAPEPDVAGDGAVRVLQMNLCDSGLARCYTGRSVGEAGDVIRAEAPDVVTLNEVCHDDVAPLERALADTAGGVVVSAFQPAWDRSTGAALRCRNGQPYGVALLMRTAGTGHEAVGGTYPMQDAGSAELRAWLCLGPRPARMSGVATAAVTVCTTHLASGDPVVAHAQCVYLTGTAIPAVAARTGSAPVILGGDLNLRADGSTCIPAGHRRADDGHVQHVVATPGLTVGPPRTIAMPATDHPGLLVTLTHEPRT